MQRKRNGNEVYTLFKCGEASRVRSSEFTQLCVTAVSKYWDLKHVSKQKPIFLFSNAPVSPIAGLAGRVPLLTSVLPSYRRNAIAKSLKVLSRLCRRSRHVVLWSSKLRDLKLTEYVHLAHYDRKLKILRHELFSTYMLKASSCLKDGMMR